MPKHGISPKLVGQRRSSAYLAFQGLDPVFTFPTVAIQPVDHQRSFLEVAHVTIVAVDGPLEQSVGERSLQNTHAHKVPRALPADRW